jgi:penicillin-binding protein 1A
MTLYSKTETSALRYPIQRLVQKCADRWLFTRMNNPLLVPAIKGVAVVLLTALSGVLIFLFSISMGAFGKLPEESDLKDLQNFLASEVLAEDGTLLGRYYFENRSIVTYPNISPNFINALLATEDARFFEHAGVDLRSWGRVLVKSLLLNDRSSGGGSTITQQLAKNLFPRQDYPHASLLINKMKEVMIARRLEQLYSKEEILELYLNTVPFSENTYGIKVASHRFFDTEPHDLTVLQSAVLVAMLKATSTYNPVAFPERSVKRRNLVLDLMEKHGYLNKAEALHFRGQPLSLNYSPLNNNEGLATYLREHLRLELKELLQKYRKPNGMAYNLYTDGLKIYTTLDADLQRYAEEAVAEHLGSLQQDFERHLKALKAQPWENDTVVLLAKYRSDRYRNLRQQQLCEEEIDSIFSLPVAMTVFSWDGREKEVKMSPIDSIKYYLSLLNAGLLAIDPQTGAVKAWVGGIDHKYFKYDHVKSRRQVGSTFKPIVYTKAIQKGIHPCAHISDHLRTYPRYDYWQPRNADNKYGAQYSMEGGLINSVNTVTVNLAMRSKPASVAGLAKELGISGEVPAVPSIALGAVEASLMDMVRVYGTFANRGRRPEISYIQRIETADGQMIVDFSVPNQDTCSWNQVLATDEADLMNEMLQSAVNMGTGRRLRWRYHFKNELAGKTGTSQNHSDGWFIGYNPRLVAGVWVGAESPSVRFRSLALGQGANTALPVFANLLSKINQDTTQRALSEAVFSEPSIEVKSMLNCRRVIWPEKDAETNPEEQSVAGNLSPASATPVSETLATVNKEK